MLPSDDAQTQAPRPRGGYPKSTDRYRLYEQLSTLLPGLRTLAGRRARRTVDEYTDDGIRYLHHCQQHGLAALEPASLRHWRQVMVDQSALSPHTINRRIHAVKSLVKATAALDTIEKALAYEFSLVEKVQVAALRHRLTPHRRLLLTPEQVRALCRAPDPRTVRGLRDRAVLHTLASSGCRISELASLQRGDIVPIGQSWGLKVLGKGASDYRSTPLSPEAHGWIQRWLAARESVLTATWVFTACDGAHRPTARPLYPPHIRHLVQRYAQQIGLPHVTPHHLRKFVGTQIAKKYGARQGQRALGHKLFATFEQFYWIDQLEEGLSDDLF